MDAVAIRQSRPGGHPSKGRTFRSGYNYSDKNRRSAISRSEFPDRSYKPRCMPYWTQQGPRAATQNSRSVKKTEPKAAAVVAAKMASENSSENSRRHRRALPNRRALPSLLRVSDAGPSEKRPAPVAGVRKPSMKETRDVRMLARRRALWGFECRGRCAWRTAEPMPGVGRRGYGSRVGVCRHGVPTIHWCTI